VLPLLLLLRRRLLLLLLLLLIGWQRCRKPTLQVHAWPAGCQ
jgi:hypothetical protein